MRGGAGASSAFKEIDANTRFEPTYVVTGDRPDIPGADCLLVGSGKSPFFNRLPECLLRVCEYAGGANINTSREIFFSSLKYS